MRVLTVTSLFPRATDPGLGIFIETRMRHFRQRHPNVEHRVIAPVPWFPLRHPRFGRYADCARTPRRDNCQGVAVYHPRYLVIPKVGMLLTPFFMALSIGLCIARLRREGFQPDLIDGHYLYPDGVAIALSQVFQQHPFTLTARGTDLHSIPRYRLPRRMILWASRRAARLITVCDALREEAIRLGVPPALVLSLRNGIDLERFHPPEHRASLRAELGLQGPCVLAVGRLMALKGQHLIIEAMAGIPGARLLLVGQGPDEEALRRQVAQAGLSDRVDFLGRLDQAELARYYGAADVSVLASSHEGWANVLLESLACGTPVLATRVWGTPEVIQDPCAGRLTERSAPAIRQHLKAMLAETPDRAAIRRYAEGFSWDDTSDRLYQLFRQVLHQVKAPS